jgi:hypothetical protein
VRLPILVCRLRIGLECVEYAMDADQRRAKPLQFKVSTPDFGIGESAEWNGGNEASDCCNGTHSETPTRYAAH